MIPDDDKTVVMQSGRAPFAKLVPHALVAEIFFPKQLAIHVDGVQTAGLEVREDVLSPRCLLSPHVAAAHYSRGLRGLHGWDGIVIRGLFHAILTLY